MNFDNRSIAFNNESQMLALDSGIGKQMDDIFLEDLKHADEIKLDTFRQRSWFSKVLERGASLMRRIL
jgi:cardiolipin synthase